MKNKRIDLFLKSDKKKAIGEEGINTNSIS